MCTSFGDHGHTVGRACDNDSPAVGRLLLQVSGVDFGNDCPHYIYDFGGSIATSGLVLPMRKTVVA